MREDDSIVPGERIGPFCLGTSEVEILAHVGAASVSREQRGELQILHSGSLSFWFDKGVLTQVGAHSDYGGSTARGIGIGSTLAELAVVGNVGLDLDDGVLLLDEVEGICFDVEQGLPEMSQLLADSWTQEDVDGPGFELDSSWTICWIGVFDAKRVEALEREEALQRDESLEAE
jgi:hypothetical protein